MNETTTKIFPYLERLLDGEEVEWKTLGEVCVHLRTGLNPRRNFKLNTEDASNYYVTVRELGGTELLYSEKTDLINDDALQLINNRSKLKVNDILFSGTGTIGKTAFISKEPTNWNIKEGVYALTLNTHYVLPMFVLRYLQTQSTIDWIDRMAAGGIVRSITMKNLEQLPIPLPPLRVQARIVEILDKFTQLEAQLEAELQARRKQYAYYRDQLLNFSQYPPLNVNIEWKALGEIGKFCRGTSFQKKDFAAEGVGCIHYGEIYTRYGITTQKTISKLSKEKAENARMAHYGDLIIATTSENDEDVCKSVAWLGTDSIVVSNDACYYQHTLDPKYVAYFFQTNDFQQQKRAFITGTKVRRVNPRDLAKIIIPIPPLSEQRRIVDILDRFDTLTNSISEGLPKEIALRRKQYAYYRDALLSFPRPEVSA